jgi:acyl carrier protein
MSENVQDRVLRIVETARQKPPGSISPDSSFEELGIDSLDRLNLLFDLEGEFDIQIDDEQAKTVTTLRQMIDGIQMLVNQKQSSQAS